MSSINLLSYLSEFFLMFVILYQFCMYIYKTNQAKYNFSTLDLEIYWQIQWTFFFMLFLYSTLEYECFLFNDLLINDFGSVYLKIFYIFVNIYVLALLRITLQMDKIWFLEYFTFYLIANFAALCLINSSDLILIFLLVETFSMCFYIMSGLKLDSFTAARAALKYVLIGAYLSGLFLYGSSILYSFFGTVNLLHIYVLLPIFDNTESIYSNFFFRGYVFIGFFLVFISLLFKLNSAPFHFWAVDVYDDAPLSSTIVFSTLPKLVLQLLIVRFSNFLEELFYIYQPILLFLGLLSITFGIFFALKQKRLKLLIIFSAISQVGFLLFSISDTISSIEANAISLFFLIIYTLTSLLVWFFIVIENLNVVALNNHENIGKKKHSNSIVRLKTIKKLITTKSYLFTKKEYEFIKNLHDTYSSKSVLLNKHDVYYLDDLKNKSFNEDLTVISYLLIFFSFASIPALAGFIAKFYVIFQLFVEDNYLIGIYILILSAFATYYYINILKLAFFEYKNLKLKMSYNSLKLTTNIHGIESLYIFNQFLLAFLVLLFLNPNLLYVICERIVLSICL